MAPPEADVFVRSAVECRVFLLFCVYFAFSTFTFPACHALLKYSRQALLEIDSTHSLSDFSGSIPQELQNIIRYHGNHHHNHHQSREDPESPGSSELADPKIARRRRRHKRGKRGGLHARLKARASRPPLPSLLLANVRSLENKLDELRARITTHREVRECCPLIFT